MPFNSKIQAWNVLLLLKNYCYCPFLALLLLTIAKGLAELLLLLLISDLPIAIAIDWEILYWSALLSSVDLVDVIFKKYGYIICLKQSSHDGDWKGKFINHIVICTKTNLCHLSCKQILHAHHIDPVLKEEIIENRLIEREPCFC